MCASAAVCSLLSLESGVEQNGSLTLRSKFLASVVFLRQKNSSLPEELWQTCTDLGGVNHPHVSSNRTLNPRRLFPKNTPNDLENWTRPQRENHQGSSPKQINATSISTTEKHGKSNLERWS